MVLRSGYPGSNEDGEEAAQPHLCPVSHLIKRRKRAIHFISVYVNVKN